MSLRSPRAQAIDAVDTVDVASARLHNLLTLGHAHAAASVGMPPVKRQASSSEQVHEVDSIRDRMPKTEERQEAMLDIMEAMLDLIVPREEGKEEGAPLYQDMGAPTSMGRLFEADVRQEKQKELVRKIRLKIAEARDMRDRRYRSLIPFGAPY